MLDEIIKDKTKFHAFIQCGAYKNGKKSNSKFKVLWGVDPDAFKKKLSDFLRTLRADAARRNR